MINLKGKVKFYNIEKGFGFIAGEDNKDYFVHHSQLVNNFIPRDNDEVEFEPKKAEKGLQATEVKLVI